MTGYLQRLIDSTPGIAPAPEPVLRSRSPVAETDRRLALDPFSDIAVGMIESGNSAPALAIASNPVAPPAAHAATPTAGVHAAAPVPASPAPVRATAPMTASPAPVAVQRFLAPSVSAAPSIAALQTPPRDAVTAFARVPEAAATPSSREPVLISPPAIVNDIVHTAAPIPEVGLTPLAAAREFRTIEPQIREPLEPGADEPVRNAAFAPPRAPDELAYATPVERMFETLQQAAPPARIVPPDVAREIASEPQAALPPQQPKETRTIPAREIRETIREIVREVMPAKREAPRIPRTAAEASVIGPLGDPNARARRLTLLLR